MSRTSLVGSFGVLDSLQFFLKQSLQLLDFMLLQIELRALPDVPRNVCKLLYCQFLRHNSEPDKSVQPRLVLLLVERLLQVVQLPHKVSIPLFISLHLSHKPLDGILESADDALVGILIRLLFQFLLEFRLQRLSCLNRPHGNRILLAYEICRLWMDSALACNERVCFTNPAEADDIVFGFFRKPWSAFFIHVFCLLVLM